MTHPFFKNKWYIVVGIAICLLGGLLNVLIISPLLNSSFFWLFIDGTINCLILAAISIPLWIVIKFVDFSGGPSLQRWLNSFALCILTVGTSIGLDLFINYLLLPDDVYNSLLSTIPLRIVLGILLYIMLVQHFLVLVKKDRVLAKEEEEEKLTELISDTETTNSATEIIDRIAIKLGSKIHVIAVPDILYLQAEGDYVMIYTSEGNYLKEQTMKYFEQHLPQQKFVRVHRSCIVNVEIISRVELYEKQNYLLHLQNGTKIKASTNGYRLLKKTLSL